MGTPTLNEPALAAWVLQLDPFRKKRNPAATNGWAPCPTQEATEMLAQALRVRHDVAVWIEMKHPDLLWRATPGAGGENDECQMTNGKWRMVNGQW